jgi:hypothetical protein
MEQIYHHQLPRDEIVIMTKAFFPLSGNKFSLPGPAADAAGLVNQYGLSRKIFSFPSFRDLSDGSEAYSTR